MKLTRFGQLPGILAVCSLAACAYVLTGEIGSFREAVGTWAKGELLARTQLAAEALDSAVATGDFRRIREFGDSCRNDGVRLTILSGPGGVLYDSAGGVFGKRTQRPEAEAAFASGVGIALRRSGTTGEDMLFCARRSGENVIRLAIPASRVYAPFQRARIGLVLSGFVGAFAILFVFLFTNRLVARIRERERLLDELRREEKFRSEFMANLTHELKTPLTGILGAVDLLDDGDGLTADNRRTLLGLLRNEAHRIDSLVRDILELSRLEECQRMETPDFVPADLSEIIGTISSRLQPKALAAGIKLEAAAVPSVTVKCDVQLIETALTNLVENALRYSGSPDVVISLSVTEDMAVIAVEDHGSGIPAEHRARIFERFYRVDKDRSREMGGTGLGLAIVKHIAALHGGTATLTPVPSGGCRFELSIPLA